MVAFMNKMNINDKNITAKIVTVNGNQYNMVLNTRQSILQQFEDKIAKTRGNSQILDGCVLLYNGMKLNPSMTPDSIGMENGEYLDLLIKS